MGTKRLVHLRRALRWILVSLLLVSAGLLIAGVLLKLRGEGRGLVLLTLLGLSIGGLLADVHAGVLRRFPRSAFAGLVIITFSQACYLLLLWTGWTAESLLWRLWWMSLVAAVSSTHVLVLRIATADRDDWIKRGTFTCVGVFVLTAMGLALYRDLPPEPGAIHVWLGAVSAGGALIGSLLVWSRWAHRRARPSAASRRTKVAWLCVSHAILLLLGWYVGRTALPHANPFDMLPSPLTDLSPTKLDAQVRGDFARLRTIAASAHSLAREIEEYGTKLSERLTVEKRDHYLPEEEDRIRSLFMSHLSYRTALLRLVATYASFEVVRDPEAQARCFMVGYAAAMTTLQTSLKLIVTCQDQPLARHTLNQPEREWRTPAGMFDRIYDGVADRRNIELVARMAAYFESNRGEWRQAGVWSAADYDWLETCILEGVHYLREHRVERRQPWTESLLEQIESEARPPVYSAQSAVFEWLGDTRIVKRPPLIGSDQIEEIASRVKPGDILLGRSNWYLSNAFLPGFWSHAALYVGRLEDLRRLGIAEHPTVQAVLEEYLQPGSDGKERTVIEAVSEGVLFNSLARSLHTDYVAVLRPRLSEGAIAEAIVRAFRHHGKPYDFDFDFFTTENIACTELIYHAYQGMLHFELVRVMGRDTVPALEIVRKFARERDYTHRELDFVLFLDAVPATQEIRLATEDEFVASADRPPTFNE